MLPSTIRSYGSDIEVFAGPLDLVGPENNLVARTAIDVACQRIPQTWKRPREYVHKRWSHVALSQHNVN